MTGEHERPTAEQEQLHALYAETLRRCQELLEENGQEREIDAERRGVAGWLLSALEARGIDISDMDVLSCRMVQTDTTGSEDSRPQIRIVDMKGEGIPAITIIASEDDRARHMVLDQKAAHNAYLDTEEETPIVGEQRYIEELADLDDVQPYADLVKEVET